MGIYTTRLLTSPTEKAVNPAMAPCTAFCAKMRQSMESEALAGTERIM